MSRPIMGEMTMINKIGIAAAIGLAAFVAVPSASVAQEPQVILVAAAKCLGGACVGENPDRARRPERMNSFKRKRHHS
jgi:uncharacterized membrane protein